MLRPARLLPLLALLLCLWPGGALAGASLLPNGDFSKPNRAGDWPAGWGGHAPDNGLTWETGSGTRFLRLVSQTPGQLQLLSASVPLPEAVSAVTVTVRYRTANVTPGAHPDSGARLLFVFGDAAGRLVAGKAPSLTLSADAREWTDASARLVLPAGATRLTLLPGLLRADAGTLDLAEIKVVPDDSASERLALAPPAAASLLPASGATLPSGLSWEEEDGRCFLRLVSEKPGQMQMHTSFLPLTPDLRGLEIGIRYRTVGVRAGEKEWFDARSIIQFLDADGQVIRHPSGSLDLVFGHKPEPTGWREAVRSCRVPDGAVQLRLMSGLFMAGAGTVDLEKIEVRPLDDTTLDRLDLVQSLRARRNAEDAAKHERRVEAQLAAQLAATGNLVPNGGFELPGKSGDWPDGWGKKKPDDNLAWGADSGDRYLRLSADPAKTVMLYRMLPLPAGTPAVEVSLRYRTTDLKKGARPLGDARVILRYLNGTRFGHLEFGETLRPEPANLVLPDSAGAWREVSRRYLVPDGATKLQFMPGLWNAKAGTLDFSEIRVVPLSAADAAAMKAEIAAAAKQKADRAALIEKDLLIPPRTPEIKVSGNQLVTVADGRPVWLQGLCVDSMEWGPGENIHWSVRVALDEWKANVIRLPVNVEYWFGRGEHQAAGTGESYRRTVDEVVRLAAGRGAWLVLDLHAFGPVAEKHVAFWKDAAARYKNNPAVLFELYNEPVGVSWKIWRDGGSLSGPDNRRADNNPVAVPVKVESDTALGMQALVDAVRSTGARNTLIAGGIDWGYDLSGILEGHALSDPHGNGIVYSSHVYPWLLDWRKHFLAVAEKHPLFIGEVGTPPDYERFQFIPPHQRYPIEGWATDMLAVIQQHRLHWTGFSFHPACGPMVILDWDYTPTPYWGVHVKDALGGHLFELKNLR